MLITSDLSYPGVTRITGMPSLDVSEESFPEISRVLSRLEKRRHTVSADRMKENISGVHAPDVPQSNLEGSQNMFDTRKKTTQNGSVEVVCLWFFEYATNVLKAPLIFLLTFPVLWRLVALIRLAAEELAVAMVSFLDLVSFPIRSISFYA